MRRRRGISGFTLIELVVVVAIVGILLSLAAYNITRSRRRVTLERAASDLQGRILKAQALAAVAGSRLGPVRDPLPGRGERFVYGPGCTPDPALQLWVRFLGGNQVEIPAAVNYDDATDELTVTCELFDLGVITQTAGVFNAPAGAQVFGFAPSGRLIVPAGPPAPVFVQVGEVGDNKTFGFRVLPSGVICPASTPAGALCDQETGT